jgi:AcrR family transcriptional regulator
MEESDASGTSEKDDDLTRRIVEAAVQQAEEVGWENVRLRLIAEDLGVPLEEIGSRVRDLDGVADAWFARAWKAMQQPLSPELAVLPAHDRLEAVLWRWFESLSGHRHVTVQMLKAKLWPFHPHHWVPLPFNLSRTILWLRDAAGCDDPSPRREVEEVGLTWLFLATLAVWSRDDSENQQRTRRFLHRRLGDASSLMTFLFGAQSATRATP